MQQNIFVLFCFRILNKNMLVKYYGENSYEDLRTMVLESKWTVDEMTKLAKGMYYDLNGNSEVDIEDQFGFLSVQHNIDGFYFGAGDAQLVDLIYDSRMSDIGVIFNTSAFFIPRLMIQEKRSNLSWYLTTQKGVINKEIKAINNIKF